MRALVRVQPAKPASKPVANSTAGSAAMSMSPGWRAAMPVGGDVAPAIVAGACGAKAAIVVSSNGVMASA